MIRAAEDRDCAVISDIWSPVIRGSLATFNSIEPSPGDVQAMLQEKRRDDHGFLVCIANGRPCGFASYSQFRKGVGYARCMEHTIVLGEGSRGAGMGRRLMDALENHARQRGVHSMMAGVSAENMPGVRFHVALGYRELARLPQVGFKSGSLLDLVLLQKFL